MRSSHHNNNNQQQEEIDQQSKSAPVSSTEEGSVEHGSSVHPKRLNAIETLLSQKSKEGIDNKGDGGITLASRWAQQESTLAKLIATVDVQHPQERECYTTR